MRNQSDHHPLLLSFSNEPPVHHSSFKFQSLWLEHEDCRRLVEEVWARNVAGCPMFILAQKLRNLKIELKIWINNTFGIVHQNVVEAEESLESIQHQLEEVCYLDDLLDLELKAQMELDQSLHLQEIFWKEKASLKWFASGDRNSSYIHKMAKVKQSSKMLSFIRHEDRILDKLDDIERHVLDFYSSLFSVDNDCVDNNLVEYVIPKLVTEQDNVTLTNIPNMEEVR